MEDKLTVVKVEPQKMPEVVTIGKQLFIVPYSVVFFFAIVLTD